MSNLEKKNFDIYTRIHIEEKTKKNESFVVFFVPQKWIRQWTIEKNERKRKGVLFEDLKYMCNDNDTTTGT